MERERKKRVIRRILGGMDKKRRDDEEEEKKEKEGKGKAKRPNKVELLRRERSSSIGSGRSIEKFFKTERKKEERRKGRLRKITKQ